MNLFCRQICLRNVFVARYVTSVSVNSTDKPSKTVKKRAAARPRKLPLTSRESKVPATRLSRIGSFGGLAVGLGLGAASEILNRTLSGNKKGDSVFLTEANANRIVEVLCRVRGAGLKLGQMFSLQDSALINPQLQEIFERVRDGADFMPVAQLDAVMRRELGDAWRTRFASFDSTPFAAASIGQVHRAVHHDGRELAVKVQYPGVADSIGSDIENMGILLKYTNLVPEGLYAENVMKVAKIELAWECNYTREAEYAMRFRSLLEGNPDISVPEVIDGLSTRYVMSTEMVQGVPLDKLVDSSQEVRNRVSAAVLGLCMNEIFRYKLMQTDPNWSNFLYDERDGKIHLLDFGSTRDYSPNFTDVYVRVLRCAQLGDREGVLHWSTVNGFLTGYETAVMRDAFADSVMILGEAFHSDDHFDFSRQNITERIHRLIPVMVEHRLTPPPDETYSLHRKMAGIFLLCARLRSRVDCRSLFEPLWHDYVFADGSRSHPDKLKFR